MLSELSSANCWFVALGIILIVLLTLSLVYAPKGKWFWGQVRRGIDRDKIQQLIDDQQSIEVGIVGHVPTSPTFDEQNYFVTKIHNSIQYAIGRHDWYERQRINIYQLTLAAASFMFVICGLALGVDKSIPFHFGFFAFFSLLIAIIGIVFALWRYNAELDGDRPYRSISDIRFWYFRYNLPNHSDNKGSQDNIDQAKNVLNQRNAFFERVRENLNLDQSLREDLEQLFILQVLQRYKSESLTKMRWGLIYMVAAFCVLIVLSMVAAIFK